MLPVNSTVRIAKASGVQIREWLEKELNNVFAKDALKRLGGWVVKFKGMKIEFKAFEEQGKRVKSVLIQDQPLENNKLYTICACERDGDPENVLCRMVNVVGATNTQFNLHQVLKEYLKIYSPVTPLPEGNAVVLDAPATLLTQVSGVDYHFV